MHITKVYNSVQNEIAALNLLRWNINNLEIWYMILMFYIVGVWLYQILFHLKFNI